MEPITSHGNARLKHARKLQARRHRRALGQFLAEGEDIVEEALAAGILPVETLIAADRPPDEGLIARLARGGPVLPCATRCSPRWAASATRPASSRSTTSPRSRMNIRCQAPDIHPWPSTCTG